MYRQTFLCIEARRLFRQTAPTTQENARPGSSADDIEASQGFPHERQLNGVFLLGFFGQVLLPGVQDETRP